LNNHSGTIVAMPETLPFIAELKTFINKRNILH